MLNIGLNLKLKNNDFTLKKFGNEIKTLSAVNLKPDK